MIPNNALTESARLFVATLAASGVTDVVVSPGSRSTPLVVALVREPRIRCHSVVDERSAAFFALGQARIHERPSAVLCTSGTALVHYLPALVEASLTGVPLVVVSADRPHELQHCHAPQTIDQVKIFGEYVRAEFDVPAADGTTSSLVGVRRMVAQAVASSMDPRPGPVHLNFRARKPLEPRAPGTPEDVDLVSRVDALLARRLPIPGRSTRFASSTSIDAANAEIEASRRGIIVCGPALSYRVTHAAAIAELSRRTGFPVYTEATSQLRYGPWPADVPRIAHLDLLVRKLSPDTLPDLVIQVGLPPTFELLPKLESMGPAPSLVVLSEDDFCDPSGLATTLVFGDIGENCRRLSRTSPSVSPYASLDEVARRLVRSELQKTPFAEGQAVRALVDSLGSGDTLVVGNSLAVRALDTYTDLGASDIRVVSQRGASGIDGNVALAAGVSHAQGGKTTLLCGDVTLLHDVGSFMQAKALVKDLRIVVVNNGGGRIFEQLPIVAVPDLESKVLDLTLTPHATEFALAAAAAGSSYARVTDEKALREALAEASSGLRLIEVIVEPSGAIAQSKRLWKALGA